MRATTKSSGRSRLRTRSARRDGWVRRGWAGLTALLIGSLAQASDTPKVTFAELSACPLVMELSDPRLANEMPPSLRAARDSRVRLTGYMLPLVVGQGRTSQFLLMRNQNACCFGQMPAANEFVVAETGAAGVAVRMDAPVTFEGRLRIAPVVSGGAVVQFFNLEDVVLAPATR